MQRLQNKNKGWRRFFEGFDNRSGFSLTEVLVAVMVLVVAIVASASLLVSMSGSNKRNTQFLQAYYYTQESLEAFRNMRDTHFMHNLDYRGDGSGTLWVAQDGFSSDGGYGVMLNAMAFSSHAYSGTGNGSSMMSGPWGLSRGDGLPVYFRTDGVGLGDETVFTRGCSVREVEDKEKAVEITCTTTWEDGGKSHNVSLSAILTDWKDD
jgi:type II secretory pathway pseudopilin PulG